MKKKIFSLILIFTMFFGFGMTVKAQAEFIDDNTFVLSTDDTDINEEDARKLLLFLDNFAKSYDLYEEDGTANLIHDDLLVDFSADLPSLDYSLFIMNTYIEPYGDLIGIVMEDYSNGEIFSFGVLKSTDTFNVLAFNENYDFNVVITLPEEEIIEEEGLSIFGFFNNFYSNYIFPNNILDSQTLNLITAVTTLLFFIGVFRGIWSIFKGRRK